MTRLTWFDLGPQGRLHGFLGKRTEAKGPDNTGVFFGDLTLLCRLEVVGTFSSGKVEGSTDEAKRNSKSAG